jgi:hypothetical protein
MKQWRQRKIFFFEKKKQKPFVNLASRLMDKVLFASFSFKKKKILSSFSLVFFLSENTIPSYCPGTSGVSCALTLPIRKLP